MIIFLFISIGFINSQIIDDKKAGEIEDKLKFEVDATIGNYKYNFVKKDGSYLYFYLNDCGKCKFGLYPYRLDLPQLKTSTAFLFRNISISTNFTDDVEKSILMADFNQDIFKIRNGISYTEKNNEKIYQVIFVWDTTRTFMILNEPVNMNNSLTISLGRGTKEFNYLQNIPSLNVETHRLIFEISTSVPIKIGCQNIFQNMTNQNVLPLSLSTYRLHNFGGQKIYIQGPCYNESEPFPKLEIENVDNPNFKIADISIQFNHSKNSFSLITPSVWYTGKYQFKLTYQNFTFISIVQIYSIDDETQTFQILDKTNLESPNSDGTLIKINIPNYNCVKISFYIANLSIINENRIPLNLIKDNIIMDSKQILLSELFNNTIDIYRNVGYLVCTSETKELRWTNSFSLMGFNKLINNESQSVSQCQNILSDSKIVKEYFCPDNLIRARGLKSTFRNILTNISLFLSQNLEKYDCYIQMTFSEAENGTTCCYNKTTNSLVYGQDYYLRNNFIGGSYTWIFSPFYSLSKHFLFDYTPLILCCSIIKNDAMCSEFWDKYHSIKIKVFEEDLKGNVFGDPHFIPFKSSSHYTFRGWGDFPLVVTNNSLFDLQARCFHEDDQKSLLKAIVFRIQSIQVSITVSNNIKTDLQWKIEVKTVNLSVLETLPFNHENVTIFQSLDTKILDVYIRIAKKYRIYIKLERHFYIQNNLEYLNMEVYLSNNMKNIINGGLFGKVDNKDKSTWLYSKGSSEPIAETDDIEKMFYFTNTWKLSNNESLFFEKLNMSDEKFIEYQESSSPECGTIVMCKIDQVSFPKEDIYLKTKNAYNNRVTIDGEWSKSLGEKKVCDHPPIKMVRYSSDDFTENSKISIVNCIDSNKNLKSGKFTLICKKESTSLYKWKQIPEIQGELCLDTILENKNELSVIVYAAFGCSVFVILILALIVFGLIVRMRKSTTDITNKNLEDSARSDIPLDVYDVIEKPENEYGIYSEIKKVKKT